MKFKIFVVMMMLGFVSIGFSLTGNEVLAKAEALMTAPKDSYGLATMTLGKTDGTGKEIREMEMWMAGKEKRVIKFKKPASVKGIGLLVSGDNEMYVYLPAQKKIRRISGGSKNDDFQGTDFSYEEMGSYDYQKDYNATIVSEDDKVYNLKLTRKSDSEKRYTSMTMNIRKLDFVPNNINMYEGDTLIKVLTISEIKVIGEYTTPVFIRIENKVKKHYTEMQISDLKFDQELEEAGKFTKRFLKKK